MTRIGSQRSLLVTSQMLLTFVWVFDLIIHFDIVGPMSYKLILLFLPLRRYICIRGKLTLPIHLLLWTKPRICFLDYNLLISGRAILDALIHSIGCASGIATNGLFINRGLLLVPSFKPEDAHGPRCLPCILLQLLDFLLNLLPILLIIQFQITVLTSLVCSPVSPLHDLLHHCLHLFSEGEVASLDRGVAVGGGQGIVFDDGLVFEELVAV